MMKWSLGIPGFEYHEIDGKNPIRQGKEYGYVLEPEDAIKGIHERTRLKMLESKCVHLYTPVGTL